jgi:hypothetical protein
MDSKRVVEVRYDLPFLVWFSLLLCIIGQLSGSLIFLIEGVERYHEKCVYAQENGIEVPWSCVDYLMPEETK